MSNTVERLYETVQALPEPLLAEVLDFADFLRARTSGVLAQGSDVPLATLCGGLENTQTFSGSPLSVQRQLRDEWR